MHLLYGGRRSEGTKKGEGRGKERSDKWRGARGPTQRTLKPPPDRVGFPRKRSFAGLPLFSPSWSWTRQWSLHTRVGLQIESFGALDPLRAAARERIL
ncbi:hypothetical protein B296_00025039 [Ensete ventricosum]|uniref:Uncharacterized protein n=1 Tax=Ensete ventricosum TaxID=4639 RepID=A0A427AKL7_ENSVE|nr:hypothetical protein B296_00025039 [Ensete ventricosum]